MRLPSYIPYMAIAAISTKSTRGGSRVAFLKVIGGLIAVLFIIAPSIAHSQFGVGFSPILTGSMRPYAHPGDLFVTKTTAAANLKVGDIILVTSQSTGVFYSHRIVNIQKVNGSLQITTKGDANAAPEAAPYFVSPIDQIPRNVARVKWMGRPLVYLSSVQGRQAALILIVIANLIALMMFLFRRKPTVVNSIAETVYKDLYAEAQTQKELREQELNIYREIFEESHIDSSVKEELAELRSVMRLPEPSSL